MKSIISSAPIVRLVDDQNLQFEPITDASGVALRGVLKQGDHVIAYESRKIIANRATLSYTRKRVVGDSSLSQKVEALLRGGDDSSTNRSRQFTVFQLNI